MAYSELSERPEPQQQSGEDDRHFQEDKSNTRISVKPNSEGVPDLPASIESGRSFAIDTARGLAPLWRGKEPLLGEYWIRFKAGCTLAQHFTFVGLDIEQYHASGDDRGYTTTNLYDEELLLAIRRDVNVDHVSELTPDLDYDDKDYESVHECNSPGALARMAANRASD